METVPVAVGPEDERLHTPTDDPLWSESFYLHFSDAAGRFAGFTRLALYPKRGESEGLLCVHLPNEKVAIAHVTQRLEPPEPTVARAGALVHECREPLRRWRVRFDGDVTIYDDVARIATAHDPATRPAATDRLAVDLEVSGLHLPFFYPAYQQVKNGPPVLARGPVGFWRKLRRATRRPREILSALNMRKGRHYEQSMMVRGTIIFGGETFTFDGTGHRDHSWGPRDWAPAHRWRWLCGQMDGFAFNAMYMTIAGTHVTNGYVWTDGTCSPVEALELETTFDDTGLAGRGIRLRLTAGGKRHDVEGEVFANVPLPIHGKDFFAMYNVGRTRYRCGTRTGYGAAEFLERIDP